jgi:hypothetical protein
MDEEPMLYLLQQPNLYWKIGDEDHWTVCHEITGDTARLIAAAPELLAAAVAALADLEGIMPAFDCDGERSHPGWQTISELRAAIAKAEGRSE